MGGTVRQIEFLEGVINKGSLTISQNRVFYYCVFIICACLDDAGAIFMNYR